MKKKKKHYDDDDGRVIAPMNIEGMPWNNPRRSRSVPPQGESKGEDAGGRHEMTPQSLSRRETLAIALNAMLAGLCVALILGACGFVFIWVLTHLWT